MKLVDRLLFTTTATSAATVTVAGAVAGFRTVAQAIADGDLAINETIPLAIELGGAYEVSEFTVTSATLLTRVQVLGSSAGGAASVFAAGSKQARCTAPAEYLNGVELSSLAVITPTDAHALAIINRTTGATNLALISALRTLFGGTAPTADTTVPAFAGGAALTSSNVTASGFTLTGPAATDNVGVARYEYSLDGGTTWTNNNLNLSVVVTGRTASTVYPTRWRAVDAAGNPSAALSLSVTTAASSSDTTAPSMSGSITVSAITSSGYTFGYSAGSDNVAVDHYDTSIDGGATWASNGLNLSRVVTGRPASTTDSLRVRAADAAGLMSNVLTGTATTSAAPAAIDYNITPYNSNAIKSTLAFSALSGAGARKYAVQGNTANGYSLNLYWNINSPTPTKAYMGWGTSSTVPPAIITATQNTTGGGALNGMTPMSKATGDAWAMASNLYVDQGTGTTTHYPWIQAEDASGNLGVAECLLPTGMTVTGA